MDAVERLVRRRNGVMWLVAFAFLIWQGATLTAELVPNGALAHLAGIGELVGALTWVAATVLFLVYAGQVAKHRAGEVINDEVTRHFQSRALVLGYKVALGGIVALFAASHFVEIDVAPALRGLLILVVVTPIVAFLLQARVKGEA